LISIATI